MKIMSVYRYIAQVSPDQCNELCLQNGLPSAKDIEELANNLSSLVAKNGENALKKIMDLHPDKEIILELYQTKTIATEVIRPPHLLQYQPSYVNATGNNTSSIAKDTNTYILVAALIVSMAIISMK